MKSGSLPRRLSWSLIAAVAALVLLGWAGIHRHEQLADHGAGCLHRQLAWSVIAGMAMLLVAVPSYRVVGRYSFPLFGLCLVLLLTVYLLPPINGAHRWIRLGPVGIQPSGLAKVAFVLAMARYLMYRENYRRLPGLVWPLVLTLAPVLLILREPDLGTALVFLPVLLVMLFAAGARLRDLALVAVAGLAVSPLLWAQMSREQQSRVTAVLDQAAPGENPRDDRYHLYHAKQVLALGGVWGSWIVGERVDDPAAYHLPEAHTDFVFCVLGERFGLPGIALVLALFGLVTWRGLAIAAATREPFGRLLAAGLVALVAVEAVINMAMNVGLLPITGLSLPFVSYGGSGLVAHALGLGLVLNVGLRPGYEVTAEPFRYRKADGTRPRHPTFAAAAR